ncbi:hypothetical protein [Paenibacillus massiliensis]|uniref:hypothetical protein n=1 Tax=Paenibacillus massiliensis TaxID=225917 RepID=UPI0004718559|nr:hypothetical protein [Paenibacillus massiliensis]
MSTNAGVMIIRWIGIVSAISSVIYVFMVSKGTFGFEWAIAIPAFINTLVPSVLLIGFAELLRLVSEIKSKYVGHGNYEEMK